MLLTLLEKLKMSKNRMKHKLNNVRMVKNVIKYNVYLSADKPKLSAYRPIPIQINGTDNRPIPIIGASLVMTRRTVRTVRRPNFGRFLIDKSLQPGEKRKPNDFHMGDT